MNRKIILTLFVSLTVLMFGFFSTAGSSVKPVSAATTTMTLRVASATDAGVTIDQYKYIINVDNTGTTEQRGPNDGAHPGCSPQNANYPDSCNWVSVAGRAAHSDILTQGDQDDFISGLDLPAGKYLISVLADGYKIDGAHFTVPLPNPDPATGANVTVLMQPYDLPDATIQAEVFEDLAPTNSAPDVPAERGIAGFKAHISDYIDEVTTDVYGEPLCGNGQCLSRCYAVDGGLDLGIVNPIDSSGRCPFRDELPANATTTDTHVPIPADAVIQGKVIIPNLGPNRYALSVVPPNGSPWVQTTTLEGNHDWDAWVMEGATGLDTEFVVAGEPFPAAFFGYVRPTNSMASGNGQIHGIALAVSAYIPPTGGIGGEGGLIGAKPKAVNPIHRLFVSLSDLNDNDQTIYMHEFDCNEGAGCPPVHFDITHVPDGDYVLGLWDEPQDYIFFEQNVSIQNGESVDLGSLSMLGWWTTIEGHVFNDTNENGKRDPGEAGIPNFPIVMRTRENSIMDRGATAVTTDANGYYWMENAYPMTQWLIEEAYADSFRTTGITYQADNQNEETTILGAGVDINVHPVIGLGGRLDWGVKAYNPGENGGIVGTVSYDTTRNELDPAYAAIEDWQPSISDLTVNLYATVRCPLDNNGDPIGPCDHQAFYQLNPDGSYTQGPLLNQYTTESWERPSGCVARNVDGDPLVHGTDENVLPLDPDAPCLEAPMMGVQFGPLATDVGTPDENFGASVDGNYGFGDGCFVDNNGTIEPGEFNPDDGTCSVGEFLSLPSNRDYLVQVVVPTESDAYGSDAVHPERPLYQVTREEDINVANGDSIIPQVPPPPCAGALHIVDVADASVGGTDNYLAIDGLGYDVNGLPLGVHVDESTPVENAPFVDMGGTIYEGQPKPLCDVKLVRLSDRKSIAPGFNFFTDVPLPGRFWGLVVDDLNFSSNAKSLAYGEKLPLGYAPVGIYDYTNRLITTVESDYNGLFDVLLPSTNRINCPTPSGVCANLYRFAGNDPGTPGHWNPNYNPQYRTISAEFEAFAGLTIPADLAPIPVAVAVQIPGAQTIVPVSCELNVSNSAPLTPELFAVSKPYVNDLGSFIITGQGFGASPGQVILDGVNLPTTAWSDKTISVNVPDSTPIGPHQLKIMSANGRSTVNGLTFHVLGVELPPFPATSVLDDFNRTGFGNNWNVTNGNIFSLSSNNVRVTGTGTMRWGGVAGGGPVYGPNQEAYFTFVKVSPTATEQGLFLKVTGNGSNPDPTANNSAYIEVSYKGNNPTSVQVRTKRNGTNSVVLHATFPATFAANDTLGARTLDDGTVIVYKNSTQIGQVNVVTNPAVPAGSRWLAANAANGGRLGIRFVGAQNNTTNDARFDNFGGGTVPVTRYQPTLFEVGVGKTYDPTDPARNTGDPANGIGPYEHALQDAINDAANAAEALVVVYPGPVDNSNPRYNGRGSYYENIIIHSPLKLQGVGPGGAYPNGTPVQGTILDGIAFGGDTNLAEAWRLQIANLFVIDPATGDPVPGWLGNPDISEGQVIYVLPYATTPFGSSFAAAIDGLEIRGGDQMGFPGNLNAIFGGYPGPAEGANAETQGGAIFVNAYANNLRITNNIITNNGGTYGALRIGTPNISTALNNSHNIRIANNRIFANGGSNLAGAIGLFGGSDSYEVTGNDICGNFSAEYGGGISHFGLSPNGSIHDNRIYFNHSYDEGGGIIIAGELATNPNANYGQLGGPQGSGPVSIYNNLIQANISEDDGGGLRFLMVGHSAMDVYNNMLVNNLATHEGGGVAIDDASNVRFYNNTVMNNKTTATAITSNGKPAPAGLSTGANSDQLQPTLPGSAPIFSNPLLFNNIFWDNWAGTKGINTVTGITPGDANPWDMGVVGTSGLLSPINSIVQSTSGTTLASPGANPDVIEQLDIPISFTSWRTNINFIGAIMVTADLPPTLLGNYHLSGVSSPAYGTGASFVSVPSYQQGPSTLNAPAFDIDNNPRLTPGVEIGADELP